MVANNRMITPANPHSSGIRYSEISRTKTAFDPSPIEFYEQRQNKPVTVLSGPNNCGKTFLLKHLFSIIGHTGYLISCNRFSHVDVLNTRNTDEHEYRHHYDNFIQHFHTSHQNSEDNNLRLDQIIVGLKDSQREKLFNLSESLLGNKFSLKKTEPDNTFSPFYVDMDGENLKYGSSGTRLLLTLLGTMLNEKFTVLLIDEPEIGLNPGIQSTLAKFLYNNDLRNDFCPHISQIYVATHSHLFLDRNVFSNNILVKKSQETISTQEVRSIGDLHQLQFNMLGNELESVFLPSAIVIVEGDSDVTFMTKAFQLNIPDRRVAVVSGGGDGEIQKRLNFIKEAFGNLGFSPYRNRIFVVLDKTHSVKLERITRQGIPESNITVWSKNGIEYFYPRQLVAETFCCSLEEVDQINLENDPIAFNGITTSKKELSRVVSSAIDSEHALHVELNSLIESVRQSCSYE